MKRTAKSVRKLVSMVFTLSMMLAVILGMSVTANAATLLDPTKQVTAVADSKRYLKSEVIRIDVTFPMKDTYYYDDGTSFTPGRNAFAYKVDNQTDYQGSPASNTGKLTMMFTDLAVGRHTISFYARGTNNKVVDINNSATVTFEVLDDKTTVVFEEDFERDTLVNGTSVIAAESTPENSSIQIIDAPGGRTGKVLSNSQNNAFASGGNTAYIDGNGYVTYDFNDIPNKGVLKLEMDYYYSDTIMPCMPFILVDNNGNELKLVRLSSAVNDIKIYHSTDSYQQKFGILGYGEKTWTPNTWKKMTLIYNIDNQSCAVIRDNTVLFKVVGDINKLAGDTISALKYTAYYPVATKKDIMIDNLKVSVIEADEVTPPVTKEYTVTNPSVALEADSAVLTANVKNTTDEAKALYGIIAAYDETGALVNVIVGSEVDVQAGTDTTDVTIAQMSLANTGYANVKGFIWDSISNMNPLTSVAE